MRDYITITRQIIRVLKIKPELAKELKDVLNQEQKIKTFIPRKKTQPTNKITYVNLPPVF